MSLIKGSYKDNCIFLLKDLTGIIKEIEIEEKEKLIRAGINYSNFISKEDSPSRAVKDLFLNVLEESKDEVAKYISKVAEIIYKNKGKDLVLVSLARAGTPYGILIGEYLNMKYNINIKHYSVSIIRGGGIDFNALKYILKIEKSAKIQFVDGWTGKGSIINELKKSVEEFNKKYNEKIDGDLAVIADPAKLCKIYGTRKDIAVPNSILNSTVSGLISRTILNKEFIKESDFHGAINIDYLEKEDFSQFFVDEIKKSLIKSSEEIIELEDLDKNYAKNIVLKIKEEFQVANINNIKLSIGEATRVLLRRKAKVLLVKDFNDKSVKQLLTLAKEKNVEVREINNLEESDYRAIAIIDEGIL